jgi:C1A family cysteine protease
LRSGIKISKEVDYPYRGLKDICLHQKSTERVLSSFKVIKGEKELLKAVASQPVAVTVHASNDFMKYNGGIYDNSNCKGKKNHAVLVVGYGTEEGTGKKF